MKYAKEHNSYTRGKHHLELLVPPYNFQKALKVTEYIQLQSGNGDEPTGPHLQHTSNGKFICYTDHLSSYNTTACSCSI